MKIAMQLERSGDLAKNIAKRVPRLDKAPTEAQAASIAELGRMAAERLAAVINAYRSDNAQGAYDVWLKDTDIDERHEGVVREIVAAMAGEPDAVGDSIHLLFIAKNLERIGDHATNIAELVHYQLTGADLANRPKL
jgi:phosphate transport system protein